MIHIKTSYSFLVKKTFIIKLVIGSLELDISVRDPTVGFNNIAELRLVDNGFGFCFTEDAIATTRGMEINYVNFLGPVSTIMGSSTSKDGDLLSYFDNIEDKDEKSSMENISLNDRLINSHSVEVNRGKNEGQLPLEYIFGFCKSLKKITKILVFHLTFKTADLQNTIFTSLANDIDVTINSLYLCVTVLIPDSNTQVMFKESIKNNYTTTFDSRYTERKLSTVVNELQVDIGSTQHVISHKYLLGTFQTADRIATLNKA